MSFEEVLAHCIEAVEQGETVDTCLARYPGYADELEPLLHLARQFRHSPRAQLSPAAFGRGRAAVAAHARYHQSLQAPFQTIQANGSVAFSEQRPRPKARPSPTAKRRLWQPLPPVYRFTGVVISALFLLSLVTLVRNVRTSLPGSPVYPAKIFVEDLQGYLLMAAGQRALWHARQVEWRLQELDQLARQGSATEVNLVAEIEENVQSALAASASLPAAERTRFLQTWLAQLAAAHPAAATQSTTVVTLSRIIATVETAAEREVAPTVLQEVASPTNTPLAPTDTPTAEPSPTDTPTALVSPTSNPGRVLLPTPTNTPELSPSPVVNTPPPPAPATTTPQDFDDAVVAPTPLVKEVPQSDEDEPREETNPTARATDTPLPPTPSPTNLEALPTNPEAPTATFTPLPPPTETWTAVPTNTPRLTATTSATPDEPTNTPSVMRTPSATPDEPTNTPSAMRTPSATPDLSTVTPSPAGTTPAAGTSTPAATTTAILNATPATASTAVPFPTRTPDPSPTPAPTNTPAPTSAPTATQAEATPTLAPTDANEDEDEEPTATTQPTAQADTPTPEAIITPAAAQTPDSPTVAPTKRPRQ